jgi:hypothetical protein
MLQYPERAVAAVVFAFGSKPGMPGDDALELARLLELTRSVAGVEAAGKIRQQARRDPDRSEKSQDVDLTDDELRALADVLEQEPWPKEQEWYPHLRNEVLKTLRRED